MANTELDQKLAAGEVTLRQVHQQRHPILDWAEVTPSYGRDYPSAKAVKDDFLAGEHDFTLASTGQQLTVRDLTPGTTVLLRYKRNTMVTPFKLTHTMAKTVFA